MGRVLYFVMMAALLITQPTMAAAQEDKAEISFWESVKDSTDVDELDAYLEVYPNGKFARLAKIRLKRLQKTGQANPEQAPPSEQTNVPATEKAQTTFERSEMDLAVKLGSNPDNPKRGILGIRIMNFPNDTASELKISDSGAVFVQEVIKNSAAQAYGIAAGDVVLAVDGTPTTDIQTLVRIVSAHAPGETAELKIVRLAKSPVKFVQAFRKEAERRDTGSLSSFLGGIYSSGMGAAAPKDEKESFTWFRKAADQGHPASMRIIGDNYANGRGVGKDTTEAVKWYRKAIVEGDTNAMTRLGIAYNAGNGVTENMAESGRWFRKAAEKGDVVGMYNLGRLHQLGRGVSKDTAEAERWFGKAANLGNTNSMVWLGFIKENGDKKDFSAAVEWYRRAADKGDWDGMKRLGNMYYNGHGVGKDRTEAVKWYRKAADLGHVDAMNSVASAYSTGEGVAKDATEALKWYRKAADKGNNISMANIGLIYETGRGVSKDMSQAVSWYRQAADKGSTWAMFQMSIVLDEGRGVDKNPRAAAQNLLKAFNAGNERSRKALFRESKKWSRNTRRAVQEELRDAGVYTGRIDGQLGPSTRRAIKALKAQKKAQSDAKAQSSSDSAGASAPAANDDFGDLKDLEKLD